MRLPPSNLLVLLPLLALAGCPDDGDDGADASTTGTSTSGSTTGTPDPTAGSTGSPGSTSGPGSTDTGEPGSSTTSDTETDTDTETDGIFATVDLNGIAHEFDLSTPIPAADVCWRGEQSEPICTVTEKDGTWLLEGLRAGELGALDLDADGYIHEVVYMRNADEDWYFSFFLYTDAQLATLYETAGETHDPDSGTVMIQGAAPDLSWLPAVGIALQPSSGAGPFYVSSQDRTTINPDAAATTTAGLGMFTNVAPGEYTALAGYAAGDCVPRFGNDPLEIEVMPDTVSAGLFFCE